MKKVNFIIASDVENILTGKKGAAAVFGPQKGATAKPTFEEQLAQLQQIVNHLEQGNVPLEEALQQFQEGIKLSKELQTKLTNAEKTLGHLIDDNGDEQVYEKQTDDPSNNGGGNRGFGSTDEQ